MIWPAAYAIAVGLGYVLYLIGGLWLLFGFLIVGFALEMFSRITRGHYLDGSTWDGYLPLLIKKLIAARRRRPGSDTPTDTRRDG